MNKEVINILKLAATKINEARKDIISIDEQINKLKEQKKVAEQKERHVIENIYRILDKNDFIFQNIVIDDVLFQCNDEGIIDFKVIDFVL